MQVLPQPWNARAVWETLSPTLSKALRTPLETVLATEDGSSLTRDECLSLANTSGHELLALAAVADILRERLVGDNITYVVNRNINFTNVCFVGCKFCAFHHGPNHPEAKSYNFDELVQKAQEAWDLGATEVCIQGGLPKGLPPFYYRDLLIAIKSALPKMHIHAFSPMEITYGVQLTGLPLRDYLIMLRENGLDTMPGTAAEILHDDVRQLISKYKLNASSWEEIVRTAHEVGIRTTSTMMYGHVETPEHWVDQLLLYRRIQHDTGGFTEFVPLGFIHNNTRLFLEGHSRPGPTPEEHIRIHALARVMLAGLINNIQVSWVK
ncbi:MAG TPA: 5-amino-6-(D-ribitylamino)uracil--L-tyrosine 4-hydroxyphenyl transferase CofH, partial [Terriglobales bacterium]|nr:5-amino-6-(D-ribitylamino)uracil--L-tyrosine 4-hydroxyphenyl transferase CofH [Terriglobales bacterium]